MESINGHVQRTQTTVGDYMRARHYKYMIGRFQTPDKINGKAGELLTWNLYSYVQDNPLKYIDPEGEMAVLFTIVTSQAVNAIISQIAQQIKQMESYLKMQLQMALNTGNMEDALGAAAGLALLKLMPKNEKEFFEMGLPGISAMAVETKELQGIIGSLRSRLGKALEGMLRPQDHHDLPRKFAKIFKKLGFDINDPKFERWVEGGPVGRHQKWSREFNDEWKKFLIKTKENPTPEQVIEFV